MESSHQISTGRIRPQSVAAFFVVTPNWDTGWNTHKTRKRGWHFLTRSTTSAWPKFFISFHFISFHFISFHFISFHFISFHFISTPRVSDTWAWPTIALLALCQTKRSRQNFPLLQVGKQGLVKISTPDHIGCKFVHLGPPRVFLGAPGAADVQQSAAEECDQRTRTAS